MDSRFRLSGRLAVLLAIAVALVPAAAIGADPGRWRGTGISRVPLVYYQGVASDPDRRLWFDGVFVGLYRTGGVFPSLPWFGSVSGYGADRAVSSSNGWGSVATACSSRR
jgi:hypothetical protein